MHLILWAEDAETELRAEVAQSLPSARVRPQAPALLELEFELRPHDPLPHLAFCRQFLPDVREVRADSIRAWTAAVFPALVQLVPEGHPWSLHVVPHYGERTEHHIGARAWHSLKHRTGRLAPPPRGQTSPDAGQHRCRLIREAMVDLLRQKRRHLLRHLRPEPVPFTPHDSLVQLLLTRPNHGFLSVAQAPLPFAQRHLLSPFPKGDVPAASDKQAPSRAFNKLVEAETRLGRAIQRGETCVDLGAAPGSWTYVALNRGAQVTAVDRSPLRDDLMDHPGLRFLRGDAFQFEPRQSVDWLLCDVIAPPERSAELLLGWLQKRWCRHFVVTLKLKDASAGALLPRLKQNLPPLTHLLFLTRLSANKKELCAFGHAAGRPDSLRPDAF